MSWKRIEVSVPEEYGTPITVTAMSVSYTHLDVYKRQVVDLLHCGRQKAVNTLRELQYAGLVEIQKQGCGKPCLLYTSTERNK